VHLDDLTIPDRVIEVIGMDHESVTDLGMHAFLHECSGYLVLDGYGLLDGINQMCGWQPPLRR